MITSLPILLFESLFPFPHLVIDDFIDPETVQAVNNEWPEGPWNNHHHDFAMKRGCTVGFGAATEGLIGKLNSEAFINSLATRTGINDLSADTGLVGGGLHETMPGGFLRIHADFNLLPGMRRLYRRLNLMLYLNEGWQTEWGGALELWDREKLDCRVKIEPIAGRCVIFATSSTSFHGTPSRLPALKIVRGAPSRCITTPPNRPTRRRASIRRYI